MIKNCVTLGLLILLNASFIGCKPKTTAEKIEDKVEDTAHEAGQGMERAGEKVKDAAN